MKHVEQERREKQKQAHRNTVDYDHEYMSDPGDDNAGWKYQQDHTPGSDHFELSAPHHHHVTGQIYSPVCVARRGK